MANPQTGLRITHDLDPDRWCSFVRNHPTGNIFHTPEMHQVFSRAVRHRPTVWAVVDKQGCPQALLTPVEVMVGNRLIQPFTTRAIAYGSTLSAPGDPGMQALSHLLQAYRRKASRRVLFSELRHHVDTSKQQPVFRRAGFGYEDHLNYVVDLAGTEEEVNRRISKSLRKRVRAAERKGVTVEELSHPEEMGDAYKLLQKVYARIRVPLADRSLFEAAYSILTPKNMIKIFFARKENKPIGVVFNLIYKKRIYGWYGGADREYSMYSPHEMLEWYSLLWGNRHGMKTFDFGGAGKPDEAYGPRSFKAKFGGQLVNYGRNILVHSPYRLHVSRTGYRLARRFL